MVQSPWSQGTGPGCPVGGLAIFCLTDAFEEPCADAAVTCCVRRPQAEQRRRVTSCHVVGIQFGGFGIVGRGILPLTEADIGTASVTSIPGVRGKVSHQLLIHGQGLSESLLCFLIPPLAMQMPGQFIENLALARGIPRPREIPWPTSHGGLGLVGKPSPLPRLGRFLPAVARLATTHRLALGDSKSPLGTRQSTSRRWPGLVGKPLPLSGLG